MEQVKGHGRRSMSEARAEARVFGGKAAMCLGAREQSMLEGKAEGVEDTEDVAEVP